MKGRCDCVTARCSFVILVMRPCVGSIAKETENEEEWEGEVGAGTVGKLERMHALLVLESEVAECHTEGFQQQGPSPSSRGSPHALRSLSGSQSAHCAGLSPPFSLWCWQTPPCLTVITQYGPCALDQDTLTQTLVASSSFGDTCKALAYS